MHAATVGYRDGDRASPRKLRCQRMERATQSETARLASHKTNKEDGEEGIQDQESRMLSCLLTVLGAQYQEKKLQELLQSVFPQQRVFLVSKRHACLKERG